MGRWFVMVPLVGFALACGGGTSVAPDLHLAPFCEYPSAATGLALPEVGGPSAPLHAGVPVTVTADAIAVHGEPVRGDALRDGLLSGAERARLFGRDPADTLQVFAAADLPAARVHALLGSAQESGYKRAYLVVHAGTALQLPTAPDPAYAAELGARLSVVSPEQRAMSAAAELADLLSWCPGGQEVFAAVAHASPDQKCVLLSFGLAEALPRCPLTDGDQVLSAVQVLLQPTSPLALRDLELSLSGPIEPPVVATYGEWTRALAR